MLDKTTGSLQIGVVADNEFITDNNLAYMKPAVISDKQNNIMYAVKTENKNTLYLKSARHIFNKLTATMHYWTTEINKSYLWVFLTRHQQ